jgi:hypothetical protein
MKNKMEQEQSDLNDSYKQSLRNKAERNPTLTKNMPNVKWDQLPPRKGPNANGIQTSYKQVGTNKKVSKKNI